MSTDYEDMKGDTNCGNWGDWVLTSHSKLLEIAPFDKANTSSYERFIVTMSMSCTVSKKKRQAI